MNQRQEFLLGLTARYPELLEAARQGKLEPDLAGRVVDAGLTAADLQVIAAFTPEEVAVVERQIIESFGHITQHGV